MESLKDQRTIMIVSWVGFPFVIAVYMLVSYLQYFALFPESGNIIALFDIVLESHNVPMLLAFILMSAVCLIASYYIFFIDDNVVVRSIEKFNHDAPVFLRFILSMGLVNTVSLFALVFSITEGLAWPVFYFSLPALAAWIAYFPSKERINSWAKKSGESL